MSQLSPRLTHLLRQMAEATSWSQWSELAHEVDQITSATAWRDDLDHLVGADLLDEDVRAFARLRREGDHNGLAAVLKQSLYRHLGELSNPSLWSVAWLGTKHVIERYLDACERAVDWLSSVPLTGAEQAQRIERFTRARQGLGQSALMLSGGATLGFVHLGVVKALHQHRLVPKVLSGSSIGAMVAAGIANRTDEELDELFERETDIAREGVAWLSLRDARRRGHLLDPAPMLEVVRTNCGEVTFSEAYQRSGRILNISVSPTRRHQKARILNAVTTPEVLIPEAALASSAIPGLYPPAELACRDAEGRTVPYQPGERWIDGTMRGDLPKHRIMRLFNVNQFIVSQTNPHVLPFFIDPARASWLQRAVGFTGSRLLRKPGARILNVLSQLSAATPIGPAVAVAHDLVSQDYHGDINIHPRFQPRRMASLMSNPSFAELQDLVLEGERATWRHIPRIRAQTRIERCLTKAIKTLNAEATAS